MRRSTTVILYLCILSAQSQIREGTVLDTVHCLEHADQSYALFLPSNYTDSIQWPAIFFFEPAARGTLPVSLYQEVAEESGYLLISSNNSRNGPLQDGFKAAEVLFQDAVQRFKIDPENIYLSGFSGGSRLALSIAIHNDFVDGVIGVGATQVQIEEYRLKAKHRFSYVGLVGARDMNYREHKEFERYLDDLDMDNFLIVSNKGHQWPDAKDFKLALEWIGLQKNKTNSFEELLRAKLSRSIDSIPLSDLIYLNDRLQVPVDLSVDVKEKKKHLKKEEQLLDKEEAIKKQLTDSVNYAFFRGDAESTLVKWLVNEMQTYRKKSQKSKSLSDKMMLERVNEYLWALLYERASFFARQGDFQQAIIGFKALHKGTGGQSGVSWELAKAYAMVGDAKNAIESLREPLQSGFLNKEQIIEDTAFKNLKTSSNFQKWLSSQN